MIRISVDDLSARTGQEIGVSDWISVDQKMIDRFAEATGDHQFIHTDPDRAARDGPFGGTVAHGFLTLSLLPVMVESALPEIEGLRFSVNYGLDRLRFVSPVPAGSLIRGRFTLQSVTQKGDGDWEIVWSVSIEIKGSERPALVASWIGRRFVAPPMGVTS